MAAQKAINQPLYDRLCEVFGQVRVCNEGTQFQATSAKRSFEIPGRRSKYLNIIDPGEYYAVCCPCCGDTRFRLWINHRWNTTFQGRSLRHLVRCYNENCDELDDFQSTLDSLVHSSTLVSLLPAPDLSLTAGPKYETTMPGDVIGVDQLPKDHPVVKYLRDHRGFDVDTLGVQWGVKWITRPTHEYVFDTNRLLIPVYGDLDGTLQMLAWQTRWFNPETNSDIPPSKSTPKYITQGPKRALVYNLYRARASKLIVICEGVFDAIRVGPQHGVCTFGKTLSSKQADLIEASVVADGGRVVFAYDPDVSSKNWQRVMERVKDWPDVRYLNFPEGVDIANYSDQQAREIVESLK